MKKIRDGESQKREDAGVRKGMKVAKHCVFLMFCGPGGSKSKSNAMCERYVISVKYARHRLYLPYVT